RRVDSVRLLKLANYPAGISGRQHALWNIARHHAAGANDGAGANMHASQDQGATTHPDVRPDRDWFSVFLAPAQRRIERMQRRKDLHAWPKQRVIANANLAHVENGAIEVEKYACAQVDIGAVVAVERRLHPC